MQLYSAGSRDMPDNLTNQPADRDRAEMTAVGGFWVITADFNFLPFPIQRGYFFNQTPVLRMIKNYNVIHLKLDKKQGGRKEQDVVPW